MLVLTFVTGALDAVGYLGLDHIFTGNMTGNIVILGMGAAGGDNLPVLGPLLALAAFAIGAAIAGAVLRNSAPSWNRRITVLLSTGTMVLIGCGAALWWLPVQTHEWMRISVAGTIAVQMGSQALIARHLAVKDITTVVVTSTLTSLAGESLYHPSNRLWNRRAGAILVLFLGAVVGAGLMHLHICAPVFLSAALTGAVTAIGARKWNPRRNPADAQ